MAFALILAAMCVGVVPPNPRQVAADTYRLQPATLAADQEVYSAAAVGNVAYLFGGSAHTMTRAGTTQIVRYDMNARTSSVLPATMSVPTFASAAATVGTDIYVFGGTAGSYSTSPDIKNTITKFDSVTETATTAGLPTLPAGRYGLAAAELGGKVYLFGGSNGAAYEGSILAFDPAATPPTITTVATWSAPTGGPVAASDGTSIYVMGGCTGTCTSGAFSNDVYRFTPGPSATVTKLSATAPSSPAFGAAVGTGTGIYVFGGGTTPHAPYRFLPTSGTFETRSGATSTWAHAAVAHGDVIEVFFNNQVYTYNPYAPDAPTGLTAASGPGLQTISLWWTAPANPVTSYNVYRSTAAAGPFSLVGSSGTTAYQDNLAAGDFTTYYYQVTAANSYGEGDPSNVASAWAAGGLGAGDTDMDGLSDSAEAALVPPTNPHDADTDDDGVCDGGQASACVIGGVPYSAGEVLGWNVVRHENEPQTSYGKPTDATDRDGDGLNDLAELQLGTDPEKKDTDGDFLPDNVESPSWPHRVEAFCSTPAATSCAYPNPNVRDLYVEMDWVSPWKLRTDVYDAAMARYSSQPDSDGPGAGFRRVLLHVDYGQFGHGGEAGYDQEVGLGTISSTRAYMMGPWRQGIFHYGVVACNKPGDDGYWRWAGEGNTPGMDFVLYACGGADKAKAYATTYYCGAVGLFGSSDDYRNCILNNPAYIAYMSVTFMHELGHNVLGQRMVGPEPGGTFANAPNTIAESDGTYRNCYNEAYWWDNDLLPTYFNGDTPGDTGDKDCNNDGTDDQWAHAQGTASGDTMSYSYVRDPGYYPDTWRAIRLDWQLYGTPAASKGHSHGDDLKVDFPSVIREDGAFRAAHGLPPLLVPQKAVRR
jgi:hypothetical protein